MPAPIPVLEWSPTTGPFSTSPVWEDLGAYIVLGPDGGPLTASHGRGDELADVDVGQISVPLANDDGRFTLGNAASPYYPNVKPGRQARYGLMVPGGGRQLVEGDPSFEAGGTNGATVSGFFSSATPTIASSTLHPADGTKGVLVTWATGGSGVAQWVIRGLIAGKTYTASFRAFVPTGSPNVAVGVAGITFGVSDTTKNALFTLSTTFVATSNTHVIQVIDQTPGGAGTQCFLDAMQVEPGSARTTFVATPGVFGWRFTGNIDRYPVTWDGSSGYTAGCNLVASDTVRRYGRLAELRSAGEEDILDDFPIAYYPMGEPAASVTVSDASPYGQPSLRLVQMGPGDGLIEFAGGTAPGVDGQSAPYFRPNGIRDGFSLVGKLRNASSPTNGVTLAVVAAPSGAPVLPAGSGRMPIAWIGSRNGSYLRLYLSGGVPGTIEVDVADARVGQLLPQTPGSGKPLHGGHNTIHAVLDRSAVASTTSTWRIRTYIDGVLDQTTAVSGMPLQLPSFSTIEVGGRKDLELGLYEGVLSHVAVYDYAVTPSPILVQAASLLRAGAGLSASFWHSKVLQFRGLAGWGVVEGATTGDDLIGGIAQDGRGPWDVLQNLARTVGGVEYVSTSGAPTLQLRTYRYNRPVAFTFDGNVDELDPGLAMPGDDAGMANDVTATGDNGISARVVDQASIDDFGLYREPVAGAYRSEDDARGAARWRTLGHRQPAKRLESLAVDAYLSPYATAAALLTAVDVGRRGSVVNLPAQAAGPYDVFCEGWSETVDQDQWSVQVNVSDASQSDFWVLGDAVRGVIGSTNRVAW